MCPSLAVSNPWGWLSLLMTTTRQLGSYSGTTEIQEVLLFWKQSCLAQIMTSLYRDAAWQLLHITNLKHWNFLFYSNRWKWQLHPLRLLCCRCKFSSHAATLQAGSAYSLWSELVFKVENHLRLCPSQSRSPSLIDPCCAAKALLDQVPHAAALH